MGSANKISVMRLWRNGWALAWVWLSCCMPVAWATDYTFPGQMPPGCSGSAGVYTCGSLSLGYFDSVRVAAPLPARITVNGSLSTNTVQINPSRPASDLTLVVNGAVDIGWASTVNATLIAESIRDASGAVTFGGALTSTKGDIALAYASTVAGSLSSSGRVSLGGFNTVNGDISSAGRLYAGYLSTITGKVSAADLIDNGAVTYGQTIATSQGGVQLGFLSSARGDISAAKGGIRAEGLNTLPGCLWSKDASAITLNWAATAGSICCGSSNCSRGCLDNNSGWWSPATCSPRKSVTLDHIEVRHASGSSLTCAPATLTVVACQDAACSALYTGGVQGSLSAIGAGMSVAWPGGNGFSIPQGSGSTTVDMQVTTPGNVSVSASLGSGVSAAAAACNFGSPACTFSAQDSGFLLTVPHHAASTAQSLNVAAVKKAGSANACVPAFASVSKTVRFACGHSDPASGTRAVSLGGVGLNASGLPTAACDGSTQALTLVFDAQGVARVPLLYADAGKVALSATHTGSGSSAGLSMTGSTSFIAAPAAFRPQLVTLPPLKAGAAFTMTVSAVDALGQVTPNFGRESAPEGVRLAFSRASPTGKGAVDGSFSGSGVAPRAAWSAFSNGVASVADLAWSEVGSGDVSATLASGSYLGSGLSVSGSTGAVGAVGPFVPDHFDVALTPACGSFSYSGQPFAVEVTARNATGGITLNHDGSGAVSPATARALTLSDVAAATGGSFTGASLGANLFTAGVARSADVSYTFANKVTPPASVVVRATDSQGVSSRTGGIEPAMPLRSGRLRIYNAFGTEKAALAVPVQVQYWSGRVWAINDADSCTVIPASAIARGSRTDSRGQATTAWNTAPEQDGAGRAAAVSAGNASLRFAPPTPWSTGSVDVAINLGAGGTDASCLSLPRPVSTGAGLPWLRGQAGSTNACAGSTEHTRDPSARLTFGIYAPESRRVMHLRDVN